jgi:hypothetical protein
LGKSQKSHCDSHYCCNLREQRDLLRARSLARLTVKVNTRVRIRDRLMALLLASQRDVVTYGLRCVRFASNFCHFDAKQNGIRFALPFRFLSKINGPIFSLTFSLCFASNLPFLDRNKKRQKLFNVFALSRISPLIFLFISFPIFQSISLLIFHFHAVCPGQCCMSITILNVHVHAHTARPR